MYSFKAPSLDYYDAYSYMNGNGLGTLYGWSSTTANSNVKSGMFDSDSTTPYDGFDKKDLSGNMLYIYNDRARLHQVFVRQHAVARRQHLLQA